MSIEERGWDHPIVKTYDSVVNGETVQVLFMTAKEANSFRARLHQYKEKLDDTIEAYDDDHVRKQLSMIKISKTAFLYNVSFKDPKPYQYVVITRFNPETNVWEELPDE